MSEMVRLPDGEVVHRSELDDGEQCLRCGGFIKVVEKDDTLSRDDPRAFRFEHQGVAVNNAPNDRVLSPHRLGILCPSCEDAFRRDFLGDEYDGEHQDPTGASEENDGGE